MLAALLTKKKALREERLENDRGFTLIELLVVVVIIGILIAIAIPLYSNYKKGAENKSAASDVRNAIPVIEQYYTDNSSTYPASAVNSSAGTALNLDSSGTAHVINVSSGNTLVVVKVSTTGYNVCGWNSDGTVTYEYKSSSGATSASASGAAAPTIATCV